VAGNDPVICYSHTLHNRRPFGEQAKKVVIASDEPPTAHFCHICPDTGFEIITADSMGARFFKHPEKKGALHCSPFLLLKASLRNKGNRMP